MERAGFGPHFEFGIRFFFMNGTIEVNDLDLFFFMVIQDVLRLDISVAYPMFMKVL